DEGRIAGAASTVLNQWAYGSVETNVSRDAVIAERDVYARGRLRPDWITLEVRPAAVSRMRR
ncbi:MAG TPA: hypothetical protein VN738_11125, partial [Acidothermaceae bacterium]|nr:hypothetical protein [Acidothermaceae bacterium]